MAMANRNLLEQFTIALVLVAGLFLFAACSETVAPSPSIVATASETAAPAAPQGVGFLSDYSHLRPGQAGQPQWIYINPQAQWSKYTKVMIDPVTFIASANSQVSPDDQKALADYFYNQLKEQLSQKATIANKPGPDVLRLRVALTDAEGATPGLRSVSVIIPQARVLNMVQSAATGSYAFVGSASCEGEVTDSVTGEQLAAWIGKREGGLALASAAQWKWGDAESVMNYWAKRLADRYVELKSGQVAS
jgi:Protein of unknown function (DUF3313)